jgi:uroporphyrinogen III methyltransferase/synthase
MGGEGNLEGWTILSTRARHQGRSLQTGLEALGARVIHIPTIEIVEPENWKTVDEVIGRLSDYDWLLLTSANAVDAFLDRVAGVGNVAGVPDVKVAVVGPQTARRFRERGRNADLIPDSFRADGLLAALPADLSGVRIVLPRAQVADRALPNSLRARGASVDVVTVYRTQLPKEGRFELKGLLRAEAIDCITLTSGSTVQNLMDMLDTPDADPADTLELLASPAIAVIGPVTARAARECGLKVDIEAESSTIPALVEAIQKYYLGR